MSEEPAMPFDFAAEITWYLRNRPSLEREYQGQYILISGCRVHYASTSRETVLEEARKCFGHQFYVAAVGLPMTPLDQIGS